MVDLKTVKFVISISGCKAKQINWIVAFTLRGCLADKYEVNENNGHPHKSQLFQR